MMPLQWTRVKSVDQMPYARVTVFDVEKDKATDKSLQAVRKGAVREETLMLFDPTEYQGMGASLTMEKYAIDDD